LDAQRWWLNGVLRELGLSFQTAHRSEHDDWIQALIASGLRFGFMPQGCVTSRDVVAPPSIAREFWREVNRSADAPTHPSSAL
jgi:LysR family hydrogen peroxide-inducible transcriptional activator